MEETWKTSLRTMIKKVTVFNRKLGKDKGNGNVRARGGQKLELNGKVIKRVEELVFIPRSIISTSGGSD